jgi:hypothetical protein
MQQSYPANRGKEKRKSMKEEQEAMKGGRLVLSAGEILEKEKSHLFEVA